MRKVEFPHFFPLQNVFLARFREFQLKNPRFFFTTLQTPIPTQKPIPIWTLYSRNSPPKTVRRGAEMSTKRATHQSLVFVVCYSVSRASPSSQYSMDSASPLLRVTSRVYRTPCRWSLSHSLCFPLDALAVCTLSGFLTREALTIRFFYTCR